MLLYFLVSGQKKFTFFAKICDIVKYFTAEPEDCRQCAKILDELETIDDEAGDAGIFFVKTNDLDAASELRIKNFPALVYYQGGLPSLYRGTLFAFVFAYIGIKAYNV